jgi:serine/threonine protein kinase
MPITIQCPNPMCRASASVADTFAGRGVKCKKCGTPFKAVATRDGQPADTKGNGPSSEGGDPFPAFPAEFGRYRVLKLLGRGGMGAVYLAEDSQLGRQVALKLPNFDASETKRVERFVREARAAAGLMHPAICPVYDAGNINGRPFITMAYLAGEPLEAAIDPDRPMDQQRAAEIVCRVALALQEAHEKGIVHRDLKPANVMLTAKGEPVVMDFGLAKRFSETDANEAKLTQQGAMMGTPNYMAPEQVQGELERIGPATDVYSLGVILFQLLTGRVPYRGSLAMVLSQVLLADVPAMEDFRADVDPRLAAIGRKAMAKDPAARFASMAAFAEALTEYLMPSVASVSPVGVPLGNTRIPSNSVPVEPVNAFAPIDETGMKPTRRPSSRQSISGTPPPKRSRTYRAVGIGAAVSGVLVLIVMAVVFLKAPKGGTTADSSVAPKPRVEPPSPPETGATQAGPPVSVVPTNAVPTSLSNPRTPTADFVPLFNGKDLSGWVVESGDTANWKVENGEIAIDAGDTIREENWFLTEKSYKDFIAKFEFKAEGGTTNSGFAYRCVPGERPVVGANNTPYSVPTHLQIELFSSQTLRDRTRLLVTGTLLGGLKPHIALKADPFGKQKPDGQWNEMEVEVRAQSLKVRLNGSTILDGNLDDLIKQGGKYPGLTRTEGRIGFQRLCGPARFRNISIKDLSNATNEVGFVPLFNGKDLAGWTGGGRVNGDAIEIVPKAGNIRTIAEYGPDFQLKTEFWLPLEANDIGQARANSGIFLLDRYEVQILDSKGRGIEPNRSCGSLYGVIGPSLEAAGPPEQWQTLDITFRAPLPTRKGEITVVLNGFLVIDRAAVDRPTLGAVDTRLVARGPIVLQDHGSPVRFRNIRIMELPAGNAAVPKLSPTLVVLSELPNGPDKSGPWVSPDGLTLFWAEKRKGDFSLWRAQRKSIDARFEGATRIGSGYDLTLSNDLCELIFADKGSDDNHHLYVRTKTAASDPQFSNPRIIPEFGSLGYLCAPCLSDDGLTLYAERLDPAAKQSNVFFRRAAKGRPWGPPEDLVLFSLPGKRNLRFPFVTADGKYLFGTSTVRL